MGKTIIQTIGPLYGEVVNGTVFGRPNGSIYVPSSNTMATELVDDYRYIRNNTSSRITLCNSTGGTPWSVIPNQYKSIAESQDIQNYITIEVAEDSAFTSIVGSRDFPAGQFNISLAVLISSSEYVIEEGTTYYVRSVLMASSNVPVATSETIEVVGWVGE